MLVIPRLPDYKVGDIKRVVIYPNRVEVYWVRARVDVYVRSEDNVRAKAGIAERKMP